eukprot:TRINITY_DN3849_c0_g1_i1.p1 TRINITY_DN3849_c0_g1~~TRINITY_DN3849_c0_g1_i1.p1  ORF type:complete len:151 (+),score=46.13 TRINITY_DN3849_c0_g1_i1:32-454(+)
MKSPNSRIILLEKRARSRMQSEIEEKKKKSEEEAQELLKHLYSTENVTEIDHSSNDYSLNNVSTTDFSNISSVSVSDAFSLVNQNYNPKGVSAFMVEPGSLEVSDQEAQVRNALYNLQQKTDGPIISLDDHNIGDIRTQL